MSNRVYSVTELANLLGAEFHGDGDCEITGIAPLELASTGQVTFLDNSKYRKFLTNTKASVVILAKRDLANCTTNAIITDKPYLGYAKVAALFAKEKRVVHGIHPQAIIGNDAKIASSAAIAANAVIGERVQLGKNVIIGPGCVIGDDCSIEDDTKLYANVTLYNDITIGKRCIIHSGVVIGADGFGFAESKDGWYKVPQLGGVEIGNDVEIGANTTIDRGALGNTQIGDGVKLDNQIQIGHNVTIGAHTIVAGCTAIAGSVTIGKYCMIAGGVCIAGHISICDKVVITGMTGISKPISEPGIYSAGIQADRYDVWKRNAIQFGHLSELSQRVKKLEQQIDFVSTSSKT